MKPINNNQEGCSPISSNCVIWQGPDLDCIDLCKGDTVSDVVYKLAKELCDILDQTNVSAYDLSCLDLQQQNPPTFEKLIQLLIDKICELENVTPGTDPKTGGACPDECIITIAECLQYADPLGNIITTLPLADYVILIGNKICDIISDINTINEELADHETRITILENATPPTYTPPQVTPDCVTNNPGVPQEMNVVLSDLETAFCNLRELVGNDTQLVTAINSMCQDLSNETSLLDPNVLLQNMTANNNPATSWTINPSNVAQLFTNAWITICDMRSAISYILDNCCDTSCSALELDVNAELISATELRLIFSGNVPNTYTDTNAGSTILISDSINGTSMTLNGINIINNYLVPGVPYIITLTNGVSGLNNLTVATTLRATDPQLGNECVIQDQTLALGANACPTLTVTPAFESVTATFTWNGSTPTTMIANVYDASGTNVIASTSFTVTNTNGSVTINNLTQGTNYKIELVIDGNACPQVAFMTGTAPCLPPENVSGTPVQTPPA